MRKTQKYKPTDWIDPRIEIRPSPIQGKGMFARAPLKQTEIVTIWGGTILLTDVEMADDQAKRYAWVTVGEGLYLASLISGDEEDLANYINHSCEPNVWLQDEVTLIARRDIAIGEELTVDYAMFEGDEEWSSPWQCQCGSVNCRGRYTGKDWRLTELQERYQDHFSPFLNARIRGLQAYDGESYNEA